MGRPRAIKHNYFFKISSPYWEGEKEYRVYRKDPISALNEIHRVMQKSRELGDKKKVLRPRLKPDEYRLIRFFQRYLDETTPEKRTVESDLDLPATPNPNVLPQKRIKTENTEFNFGATE